MSLHNTKPRLIALWFIASLLAGITAGVQANTTEPSTNHRLTWYPTYGLGHLLYQEIPSTSKANIAKQLTAKWYGSFEVSSSEKSSSERAVKNCEEFFDAKDNDMKAVKDYEHYFYSHLGLQCHTARAILEGKDAKHSYLTDFKFDETIIDVFPPDLADHASDAKLKKVRNDKSINTLREALDQINKLPSIEIESEHEIIVNDVKSQKIIKMLAKGDFNHDGFEDILVQTKYTAHQDGYRSTNLFLLTRKNKNPIFELVKIYDTH